MTSPRAALKRAGARFSGARLRDACESLFSTRDVDITYEDLAPFAPIGPFQTTRQIFVDAGTTPAIKAAEIAAAFADLGVGVATVSGNSVIFQDTSRFRIWGASVLRDGSGENNSLIVSPGDLRAILQEFPAANPNALVPIGTYTGAFASPSFGTFTFFATSTGTETAGQLFGQMQSQIAAHLGFGCDTPISVSVNASLSVNGCQSQLFDPPSFDIFWDANTSLYLGNFGLVVPQPAVPEPTSALLVGTALVGLWWRRRLGA